jgi:thiamine monophosphate kinase
MELQGPLATTTADAGDVMATTTRQGDSTALWEELLGELTSTQEVTELEAMLLNVVMKERRPMLRATIVTRMDSSDLVGT